jgi:hypothetical protein
MAKVKQRRPIFERKEFRWLRPALLPFLIKRQQHPVPPKGVPDDHRYLVTCDSPIWIADIATECVDKDAPHKRAAYAAFLQMPEDSTSEAVQRTMQHATYAALLQIPWLSQSVRNAIVHELGMSPRVEQRRVNHIQARIFQEVIDEIKRRMRKAGERPQGGVHEAAVGKAAKVFDMSVDALKQQLARDSKRHGSKRQRS